MPSRFRPLIALLGCCFASALLAGSEQESPGPEAPGSIIKRFVDPLTRPAHAPVRSLLTSDEEHASSIGPVLTPQKPVYILYHQSDKPRADEINYVLEQGRMFVNYEDPHDQTKMPMVRIRPIDGKTRIPFLIRTSLSPAEAPNSQTSLYLFVRLPIIFSPRLDVRRVIIGTKRVDFKVTAGLDDGVFSVMVPLTSLPGPKPDVRYPVEVIMEGSITLNDYTVVPPDQFTNYTLPLNSRLVSSARLAAGRDFMTPEEEVQLRRLAAEISQVTTDQYQQLLLVHRVTSGKITYFNNNMNRTAVQILTEGIGDCDDYSRVMVCLLRALGIPSRIAVGYLYDFNNMGPHGWVEAALQTRDGRPHWIICDPTLASASPDKDYFVQFRNRIYLYPIRLDIKVQNLAGDYRVGTLLNWSGKEKLEKLPPASLPALVNSFDDSLRASFAQTVSQLHEQNLALRRQFLFTPGASYILADRPINGENSHMALSIDSDERLVAELSVNDDDFSLDSPEDQQVVTLLKDAYQNLKQVPFQGSEARFCLELAYFRDRFSDRLQRVRLRVSRYLVEQHLKTIVESFQKSGLLTAAEATRITSLHQVCAGKNLYYLQELARLTPPAPASTPAPEPTTDSGESSRERSGR
ncbi:MAG: transglutaminase family protein [Acidobacteriota bacterium]